MMPQGQSERLDVTELRYSVKTSVSCLWTESSRLSTKSFKENDTQICKRYTHMYFPFTDTSLDALITFLFDLVVMLLSQTTRWDNLEYWKTCCRNPWQQFIRAMKEPQWRENRMNRTDKDSIWRQEWKCNFWKCYFFNFHEDVLTS